VSGERGVPIKNGGRGQDVQEENVNVGGEEP